jgi:hypothetical protein
VNGRIIGILDITESEMVAWHDLARHALEPNPLFEAECLIPAARYLLNGERMALVVAEEDGRFFGCFPVLRVEGDVRPSSSWAGIRRPTFTTQLRRLRYDGTPLLRSERSSEATSALLSVLTHRGAKNDAGILVLEALDMGGPVTTFLADAAKQLRLPSYTYRTWERPLVQRRDELTYRDSYEGQSVRKTAKLCRQLGDKLGGEVAIMDRSGDPLAVDQLIALEASGYKSRNDVAMVSHPGESEWFREMCVQFRKTNRVLLYSLQVGDSVVAMNLMLRAGEGLFGLQTVFDEQYAKFSPGIQLTLEVINRFHNATDAQWLDSCTFAGNETLLRIFPDRQGVSTVLIAVGGPVDRWLLRFSVTGQNLFGVDSAFRRRHPRLSGALDNVLIKFVVPKKVAQRGANNAGRERAPDVRHPTDIS